MDGGPIRDASTERRSSPDVWAFGRLSRCPDIWSIGVDWLSDSLLTPSQMLVRLVVNVTALDNCREERSRDEDRSADERACACISHACACFLPPFCSLPSVLSPSSPFPRHARPPSHTRAGLTCARPPVRLTCARPPARLTCTRTHARLTCTRAHARTQPQSHARSRTHDSTPHAR